MSTYAWRRSDEGVGHSFASLSRWKDGTRVAYGTEVLVAEGDALSCWFRVALTSEWVTRTVEVGAVDHGGEREVWLEADDDRRWRRDGAPAPELDGCVDVDVAATPLTNTFPIRRLTDLPVGEARTSPVAWVEVPSLRVVRVEQTYRRLSGRRWEYSDPAHGAFVLDVDDDGVVTTYEGFAVRVHPG